MTKTSRSLVSKSTEQGIPDLRMVELLEKLTAVVPVKLWPSLAKWTKRQGGSTYIRSLIVKDIQTRIQQAEEE